MNYLIFRDFSRFFLNFMNLKSIYFIIFLLSHAHVAADMGREEKTRHVVTYETPMCRICVHVRTCAGVRVCECTCVRRCVCVIKEKGPYLGFLPTP